MIDLLRLRPMNNSMKIFGLLMICAIFGGSCKRCYQCVVRDSADDDIQWGIQGSLRYKERLRGLFYDL